MFTFENRKTVDSTVCTVLLRARRCLRNAFYAQPFLIDTFLTLLNCFFLSFLDSMYIAMQWKSVKNVGDHFEMRL